MRTLKVYADTSVFGGVFDDEFAPICRAFFDQVRLGLFDLCVSDVTRQEISLSPANVREFFEEVSDYAVLIAVDDQVLDLRDEYLRAGVVTAKWSDDAAHVAAATVAGADLIISWNFKHIVHFDKIRRYNAINALQGYRAIDIRSPQEVVGYEEENI